MEEAISDARRLELEKQYDETTKSGDVKKRYEIAKTAVEEYPETLIIYIGSRMPKIHTDYIFAKKARMSRKNSMQMLRSIINL